MSTSMTEAEAIVTLNELLAKATKADKEASSMGACVYTAGSSTYCAEMTKGYCDSLKGAWTQGGKCP